MVFSLLLHPPSSHSFQPPPSSSLLRPPPRIPLPRHAQQQQNNHDNNNDNEPPSTLPKTQAQKATSSELRRRLLRTQQGFATPGISSAIPGATNYILDPSRTEREYLASLGLDDVSLQAGIVAGIAGETFEQQLPQHPTEMDELEKERQIALHTTLGLTHLRSLRLSSAYTSFRYVYSLHPQAYLWQLGLLQYYRGEYEDGRRTCLENARRYEAKFGRLGEVASEERIWGDACWLRGRGKRKRRMKEKDGGGGGDDALSWDEESERVEMESIALERRKVIRLARQLFSSSVRNDPTGVALARAHLQAMCQEDDDDDNKSSTSTYRRKKLADPKMYKLHSYFYLGLHYDATGQVEESKRCMKLALKTCANGIGGNNEDITFLLPVIHMTVRDWYDDEEFDDDAVVENEDQVTANHSLKNDGGDLMDKLMEDGAVDLSINGNMKKNDGVDDKMTQTIRESIQHMRIVDLREELKKRKLKVAGSKKVLQDRLVNALVLEAKA
ncbi:hypothetical protein HJC23_006999 [Cyclotella cryptica]|uniref:SAP domain-containing protein n=1 Tax=Cyclotella cryptica TaxID=29204 RepID=A0ABD3QMZ8_9STRA